MVKEVSVSELRKALGIKRLKNNIKVTKSEISALKSAREKRNIVAHSAVSHRNR